MREHEPEVASEDNLGPLRTPLVRDTSLAQATPGKVKAPTRGAHDADASLDRHARSLLQMQRQYGNRYVQRLVARAKEGEGEAGVSPDVEEAIERKRGAGQPLEDGVRTQMESAFGTDFGGVRIHTDAQADALNRSLSARAFTTGQDIFFRQGDYNPDSLSGRELLAHELTHVVQCTGSLHASLTVAQPHDEYEREADKVAQTITGGRTAPNKTGHTEIRAYATVQEDRLWLKPDPESYERRFIQSNLLYSADLLRAVKNFGKEGKGEMGGQPMDYLIGKRSYAQLERELMAWQSNASKIATGNVVNLVEAIVKATAEEQIFSSVPGPGAESLSCMDSVIAVVGIVIEGIFKNIPILGNIVGWIASIIENAWAESESKEDMEARQQAFEAHLHRRLDEVKPKIDSELYDVSTLYTYHLKWLSAHRDNYESLLSFAVPNSPESVSEREVENRLSDGLKTTSRHIRMPRGRGIDGLALSRLLTPRGLMAEDTELEKAAKWGRGLAYIRRPGDLALLPFSPPFEENDLNIGDRVYIFADQSGPGSRFPDYPGGIVLLHERTGRNAAYSFAEKSWVTFVSP